jgi:hypothetical protein
MGISSSVLVPTSWTDQQGYIVPIYEKLTLTLKYHHNITHLVFFVPVAVYGRYTLPPMLHMLLSLQKKA